MTVSTSALIAAGRRRTSRFGAPAGNDGPSEGPSAPRGGCDAGPVCESPATACGGEVGGEDVDSTPGLPSPACAFPERGEGSGSNTRGAPGGEGGAEPASVPLTGRA